MVTITLRVLRSRLTSSTTPVKLLNGPSVMRTGSAFSNTYFGFGFSAYLTSRELFSIHAICEWCASSAVIMTILVCLAVWRFLRGEQSPRRAALDTAGADADSSAPLPAPGS